LGGKEKLDEGNRAKESEYTEEMKIQNDRYKDKEKGAIKVKNKRKCGNRRRRERNDESEMRKENEKTGAKSK
jgi:hypothetical protein